MNFGEKLYYLLGKKNLTQADLARKINQKTSAVARWATGKYKPSSINMNKIAKALDVDVEELISDGHIEKSELQEIKEELILIRADIDLLKKKVFDK